MFSGVPPQTAAAWLHDARAQPWTEIQDATLDGVPGEALDWVPGEALEGGVSQISDLLSTKLRRRLYGDDHAGDDDDEGDNEDDDDDDDEDGADVMTLVDTGRYLVDTSNCG